MRFRVSALAHWCDACVCSMHCMLAQFGVRIFGRCRWLLPIWVTERRRRGCLRAAQSPLVRRNTFAKNAVGWASLGKGSVLAVKQLEHCGLALLPVKQFEHCGVVLLHCWRPLRSALLRHTLALLHRLLRCLMGLGDALLHHTLALLHRLLRCLLGLGDGLLHHTLPLLHRLLHRLLGLRDMLLPRALALLHYGCRWCSCKWGAAHLGGLWWVLHIHE